MSAQIEVKPLIRFPRQATPGACYVATVDLVHETDPATWPYPREEYAFHCVIEAGRAFAVRPLDESVVMVHRFGGSYGEARFLLTASKEPIDCEVRIRLIAESGSVAYTHRIDRVRIAEDSAADASADRETTTVDRPSVEAEDVALKPPEATEEFGQSVIKPGAPEAVAVGEVARPADSSQALAPLNEANLVVVGNEAVGKTSLIKWLVDGKPRDPSEAKTAGMVIREKIEIRHWSPEGSEVTLNIRDFGGQEIMHGTYQFFLTARSIYLLMLEARREDDTSVRDWLRTIRNRGGDSPVLVVINKCDDDIYHLQLDERRLKRDYPSIVDFIRTSCDYTQQAAESIARLRERIAHVLANDQRLKHVRDPIPKRWLRVKNAVTERARQERVLGSREFVRLCEEGEGDDAIRDANEQDALLRLLHDLGVVVTHRFRPNASAALRDVTILDPNWLTGAIYTLLNSKRIADQGGAFSRADMADLLDPAVYPERWHEFILDMLRDEEIGLCLTLPGTTPQRFLIPELLPANEPDYADLFRDALAFRYAYELLPPGLIPRFIVQAHHNLSVPPTSWRTGVILAVDECPILVRGDRDRKRIDIRVAGPPTQRRSALNVALDDLERVHDRNPGIGAKPLVPLPDQPELDVSYEHLLLLEQREGLDYRFYPPGSNRAYIVGELLEGVHRAPEQIKGLAGEKYRNVQAAHQLEKVREVWEQRRLGHWASFERAYRAAVLDLHNKLELLGIDVSQEAQRRQDLSVAYIPLNLESDSGNGDAIVASFEGLLEDAVQSGKPLIILGGAGSGKTTLLRWAACRAVSCMADPSDRTPFKLIQMSHGSPDPEGVQETLAWWGRVPFLLRLRDAKKDGLIEAERDWPFATAALQREPPGGWLEAVLDAGHALIMLDGLDELGQEGRDRALNGLHGILRDHGGNLVVLTSRPGAFDRSWFRDVPLQIATIRAMSLDQRETCIINWHRALAHDIPQNADSIHNAGDRLIGTLRRSPRLQQLATNPLICTTICALHYTRGGYLPSNLVDLLESLVRMLIHQRDEQRVVEHEAYSRLDFNQKRSILEEIAVLMVREAQSALSVDQAEYCVERRLRQIPHYQDAIAKDILDGFLLRSGLLRQFSSDHVEFTHRLFKEYMAAVRLLAERSIRYLIEHVDTDPGDRVFVFAYAIASARGDVSITEEMIHGLLARKGPDDRSGRKRRLVALRCKALTVHTTQATSQRLDRLVEEVLPPRDIEEAEAVAGVEEAVPYLKQPDAPASIQAACARALVTIGTPAAEEALKVYWDTTVQAVAEELAFAFHPLRLPFWLATVSEKASQRATEDGLPASVARLVANLEPLAGLTDLQQLRLSGTSVADLSPLAGLIRLRRLDLDSTPVADLAPLAGLTQLQQLALSGTSVSDLSALAGLVGLERLDLSNTSVSDLEPLAGLTSLQSLDLSNTSVSDLRPLATLGSLTRLDLSGVWIDDLEPVQHVKEIHR